MSKALASLVSTSTGARWGEARGNLENGAFVTDGPLPDIDLRPEPDELRIGRAQPRPCTVLNKPGPIAAWLCPESHFRGRKHESADTHR